MIYTRGDKGMCVVQIYELKVILLCQTTCMLSL